jgi:hypothetical protein
METGRPFDGTELPPSPTAAGTRRDGHKKGRRPRLKTGWPAA